MSDDANPKPEPDVETTATTKAEPEAETTADSTLAETQELAPEDRPEADAAAAERQVVYVHAPIPPKVRHNRLVGALLALLGTAVFAFAFFGAVALLMIVTGLFRATPLDFVNSSAFWVPILFFAIGSVVVAVVLNRAAWWTHIIGSAIVAVFVYFASAGMLTLLDDVVNKTPDEAIGSFWAFAASPILFIAAILAREVAIWVGLAISTRGRKVRARNAEAKAAYDAEQAEKKAEYERAAATV